MTFGPQCICPGGPLSSKANPQCVLHGHLSTPGIGIPTSEEEQEILEALQEGKVMVIPDDPVNHPSHYGGADNPYEAIKVIDAWGLGFALGNAVKYIARAGKKDSIVQDLKKAAWYLEHAIKKAEANEPF